MFELEEAMITETIVMEVEVNELTMLSFLLKMTGKNELCNCYIQRKIGGKAREARCFWCQMMSTLIYTNIKFYELENNV